MTRAQIVTFLLRVNNLFEAPTATTQLGSDTFSDLDAGHWADEAIGWAVANKITAGVGEGRFDPNGTLTRAQIVTLLYRFNNLLAVDRESE